MNQEFRWDEPCQDCGQHLWKVGLTSPLGTIYLCARCGDEAITNRESKSPHQGKKFGNLMKRVFGKHG